MDYFVKKKGFVVPIDVFMNLDCLSKQDYENWRNGRVPYLERVIKINLKKISFVMKYISIYGMDKQIKESDTVYNQWGKGNKRLQFSKSGNPKIEKAYATYYLRKEQN